jgi:hypothetical protein
VRSIDDLVPAVGDHASRFVEAIAADLGTAAAAGAASLATDSAPTVDHDEVIAVVRGVVTQDLIEPLRDRLANAVDTVDGDNDELAKRARAIYREWKARRIDDEVDDLLRHAYSRGACAALGEGERVRWVFDPAVGACSDCEDNSLQGAVTAGTAFPTGHVCAPAHSGCRCLVLRAD